MLRAHGQREPANQGRDTGLPERVGVIPNADSGLEDIEAVLDHLGVSRVWLFGAMIAGTFAIEFALLSDPVRALDRLSFCAPSVADDPTVRTWYARVIRNSISYSGRAAITHVYQQTDLRARLVDLQMPTLVILRRGDRIVPFEAGRQLARLIPKARFAPLEGDDNFLWCGDSEAAISAIEHFSRYGDASRARA